MSTQAAASGNSISDSRMKRFVKLLGVGLWMTVLGFVGAIAVSNPSPGNTALAVVFGLLFVATNLQFWLQRSTGHHRWQSVSARLGYSSFIDEDITLPNRNYLLSEIRREISKAAAHGVSFALVQVSGHKFSAIRKRRGDEFADRALNSLVGLLRRVTGDTDFLAYVDAATFVVLIVDATREDANNFLRKIPGWLFISDGHQMLDIPILARIYIYDSELMYSTDVLRELEESKALVRERREHMNTA